MPRTRRYIFNTLTVVSLLLMLAAVSPLFAFSRSASTRGDRLGPGGGAVCPQPIIDHDRPTIQMDNASFPVRALKIKPHLSYVSPK